MMRPHETTASAYSRYELRPPACEMSSTKTGYTDEDRQKQHSKRVPLDSRQQLFDLLGIREG